MELYSETKTSVLLLVESSDFKRW